MNYKFFIYCIILSFASVGAMELMTQSDKSLSYDQKNIIKYFFGSGATQNKKYDLIEDPAVLFSPIIPVECKISSPQSDIIDVEIVPKHFQQGKVVGIRINDFLSLMQQRNTSTESAKNSEKDCFHLSLLEEETDFSAITCAIDRKNFNEIMQEYNKRRAANKKDVQESQQYSNQVLNDPLEIFRPNRRFFRDYKILLVKASHEDTQVVQVRCQFCLENCYAMEIVPAGDTKEKFFAIQFNDEMLFPIEENLADITGDTFYIEIQQSNLGELFTPVICAINRKNFDEIKEEYDKRWKYHRGIMEMVESNDTVINKDDEKTGISLPSKPVANKRTIFALFLCGGSLLVGLYYYDLFKISKNFRFIF